MSKNTMGITERINEVLSYYGLNNNSFATKMGLNASTTHGIVTGRTKPSYDFLEKMAQVFADVNASWLLTGKGGMICEECIPISQVQSIKRENALLKERIIEHILKEDNSGKGNFSNPAPKTASVRKGKSCSFFALRGQIREQGVRSRI